MAEADPIREHLEKEAVERICCELYEWNFRLNFYVAANVPAAALDRTGLYRTCA